MSIWVAFLLDHLVYTFLFSTDQDCLNIYYYTTLMIDIDERSVTIFQIYRGSY
jgi:hypothetical protein